MPDTPETTVRRQREVRRAVTCLMSVLTVGPLFVAAAAFWAQDQHGVLTMCGMSAGAALTWRML